MTRIFSVGYSFKEFYNGEDPVELNEIKSVVAKDASHAISIVSKMVMKSSSYKDEETKKKVNVTRRDFDPTNITLVAETD